ncbi:MAG: hypothetical protein IJG38_02670, partial [Thermoguttaceae bacterium]|nr:hypothetical protein [Thermoguttaceae bacterium]
HKNHEIYEKYKIIKKSFRVFRVFRVKKYFWTKKHLFFSSSTNLSDEPSILTPFIFIFSGAPPFIFFDDFVK